MGTEPLERKLAAILYADVAGYSRLTGADALVCVQNGQFRSPMDPERNARTFCSSGATPRQRMKVMDWQP